MGITKALGTNVTAGQSPVTSAVFSSVTGVVANLTTKTKYYYRVRATTAQSMVQWGTVKSFTTL
jgi:phosphodiesterase/alkaline phosphatase D-like protein